jgi:chromate transporter
MSPTDPQAPQVTPSELFYSFARLTLHAFGSMLFWLRRMLVEQKRWLTEQEFVEMVALAQIMPGVNGMNIVVMVGHRYAGWKGAMAAISGFVGAPVVIVIGLGMLYEQFGAVPLVKNALTGMSSIAVGLLIATGGSLMKTLGLRWLPWMFVVLAFAGVGIMRWPLLLVLGVLAPFAIGAAWKGNH